MLLTKRALRHGPVGRGGGGGPGGSSRQKPHETINVAELGRSSLHVTHGSCVRKCPHFVAFAYQRARLGSRKLARLLGWRHGCKVLPHFSFGRGPSNDDEKEGARDLSLYDQY